MPPVAAWGLGPVDVTTNAPAAAPAMPAGALPFDGVISADFWTSAAFGLAIIAAGVWYFADHLDLG